MASLRPPALLRVNVKSRATVGPPSSVSSSGFSWTVASTSCWLSKLGNDVVDEVGRPQELRHRLGTSQNKFVLVGDHALKIIVK